jgi:hypothetical protein
MSALPGNGYGCGNCHNQTLKSGMTFTNFQAVTNLGLGLAPVYKVKPGQTAAIQFAVTNRYGGNYGLNLYYLEAGGFNKPTNHLAYAADTNWVRRTAGDIYFTVGPTNTVPTVWTFNLQVKTNTPTDYYRIFAYMAGKDSLGKIWSQSEPLYVQVAAAEPLVPPLLTSQRAGDSLSVQVATVSGFTYSLEYKDDLFSSLWSPAAQSAGDGTVKTLTDGSATVPQRFYHVRVQ